MNKKLKRMLRRARPFFTAVATFSVALLIGFVMQNEDVLAGRGGVTETNANLTPAVSAGFVPSFPTVARPAPDLLNITMLSADLRLPAMPEEPVQLVALDPKAFGPAERAAPLLGVPQSLVGRMENCAPSFAATAESGAMLGLSLSVPCQPFSRVVISHAGLSFAVLTDGDGAYAAQIPALQQAAAVSAEIDGQTLEVSVDGLDMAGIERAGLSWSGDLGFEIHARAFGADYGEDGHVWRKAPGLSGAAAGYLVRLGDATLPDPVLTEIYTSGPASVGAADPIALSAELPVTATNCARTVQAQSAQFAQGADLGSQTLEVTVPGCDVAGDYLLLNGLYEDLTFASR